MQGSFPSIQFGESKKLPEAVHKLRGSATTNISRRGLTWCRLWESNTMPSIRHIPLERHDGMPWPCRLTAGFWFAVALIAVLAGYTTAYVCMVQADFPDHWAGYEGDVVALSADYSGKSPFDRKAVRSQDRWERFFAPVHLLDRKVRRNKWNWEAHMPPDAVTAPP
jgi:hypothetical protein